MAKTSSAVIDEPTCLKSLSIRLRSCGSPKMSGFQSISCGAKTTALSLAISATGCLGLLCLGEFIAIVAFEGPKRHPIAYPATIAVGIVALLVFITLFVLYCKARKGEVKIVGIVLDVFTGGIFMLFFLIAEVGLIEIARDVYHLLERLW